MSSKWNKRRIPKWGHTEDEQVIYCVDMGGGKSVVYITKNICPTLTTTHYGEPAVCIEEREHEMEYIGMIADHVTPKGNEGGWSYALSGAFSHGGGTNLPVYKEDGVYIVRRMTPLECERVQGFPDGWTDIPDTEVDGKIVKASDTARYKALGNSLALPQWWWIICKMEKFLPDNPKLGSLFDGIGGFPLVWETKYGNGAARWASEIEPFPIAVTTYHFKEE